LIREKGVHVYIEAAKQVKSKYSNARFLIVGGLDVKNPNSISEDEVNLLKQQNIVEFTGKVNNVKDFLNKCSVFVLPSMYREGIPRSILEALSVGRAIITTNNVGCRETVIEGYNGFLVAKNSVEDLVKTMSFFCDNPNKIIEFGDNSRKYAEDKFDVNIV